MTDVGRQFAQARTWVHAPWWRRLLHKPAHTIVSSAALRMRPFMPFAREVHARTFFDAEMRVVLPEESACQLYGSGMIEEDVTTFLLTHVRPGMTFIDVGANVGYFTLLAAHLVQPSGSVHAFEPAPQTFSLLQRNTYGKPNITVHQQALWSSRTTMTFYDYGPQYSVLNSLRQHRLVHEAQIRLKQAYEVDCLPLDAYCAEFRLAPDFIKLDAESAEPHILRGSAHTIAQHKPIIALEVWDDPSRNSRDDLAFLLDHGYAPFEYQAGAITPHRLKERYAYTNILLVHPQRVRGAAPVSCVQQRSPH
jgi:FkbM family methyltransferase